MPHGTLAGDGKAEGFDRLGVALFFDQTQVERTLSVAERIAERAIVIGEPSVLSSRAEAEANPRVRPSKKGTKSRFADTLVDPGTSGFEIIDGGVKFVHGYGNRPTKDAWGRMGGVDCGTVLMQDGYYRVRIRAGASPGSRGEPMRVRAVYGANTPVRAEVEIPITALLGTPQVHEAVVFLRSGPEGLKRSVAFTFNDIVDLIVTTPENNRWYRAVRAAQGKLRDASTSGASKAEVEAARVELDAIVAEASKWKGPVRHFNPKYDVSGPPTMFVAGSRSAGRSRRSGRPEATRRSSLMKARKLTMRKPDTSARVSNMCVAFSLDLFAAPIVVR